MQLIVINLLLVGMYDFQILIVENFACSIFQKLDSIILGYSKRMEESIEMSSKWVSIEVFIWRFNKDKIYNSIKRKYNTNIQYH